MATTETAEAITQAALQLQPEARAQLTHALVQSLATLPESAAAKLWATEAERRDAELESGQVQGVSGAELFRRLYARYSR